MVMFKMSMVSVLFVAIILSCFHGRGSLAMRFQKTTGPSFNVIHFGAKGDGKTDDTQAFSKAWGEVCSSSSGGVIVVPNHKTFLLKPITFSGPCKSSITFQIRGKILAWGDRSAYTGMHWILFIAVQNLAVEGYGTIDGNGRIWWQNSCKVNRNLPCRTAPTALTFYGSKSLRVGNLKIQNGQQMHISFEKCSNVKVSQLKITAPGNSPNTDGIHIANTHDIVVQKTIIGTGDDCISIATGSQHVRALNITCGPGHGISIGSLGEDNSMAYVSDVTVNGATLSGTTNGVRIKTWQGGSGVASNIKFENIKLFNVQNPIIIDQNYCDQDAPCNKQASAVQVKNVWYKNIRGTSATTNGVIFDCSENFPCQVFMQDVDIKGYENKDIANAVCNNVHPSINGNVFPHC